MIGQMIVYAGRRARPGIAESRAIRAKDYLVWHGIAPERIVWVDGGYREEISHELFIFRSSAHFTTPTPNVAPEEAQIIGTAKPRKLKSLIPLRASEAYRRKWADRCKPPIPSS